MARKMLVLMGALLACFVLSAPAQAANIAPTGTHGGDPHLFGPTCMPGLNDGIILGTDPGFNGWCSWFHSVAPTNGYDELHRQYITFAGSVCIDKVIVYAGDGATVDDYDIQTLVAGGNPASDSDWVTEASGSLPSTHPGAIGTHEFDPVETAGVRLYVTHGMYHGWLQLRELEIYDATCAPPPPPPPTLEERVAGLEEAIGDLGDAVEALEGTVAGQTTAIGNLTTAVNGLSAAVGSLKGTYNQHTHDKGSGGRDTLGPNPLAP